MCSEHHNRLAQEPRITAFVSNDSKMIDAFKNGRDIYASIASVAFNLPYERCLEFHPVTGEYQADGKERRGQAKLIVLGICYGRSVPSIADQLFGHRNDMSDDDKVKAAQNIYDAVIKAFPKLNAAMLNAQQMARKQGYVETILGRRRHLPDMQLPEFEFIPLKGYINPDIDPLDLSTLSEQNTIPTRIVNALMQEFKSYKYFGQIARRTKELYEQHIKVINNRPKINDAKRQCLNSTIQGSAADQTKLAMIMLENSPEWKAIGGRLILPVHDELIAEVPMDKWKEGGRILSAKMVEAASFLPFPSKCDVTTTLRWYGLEYPCKYDRPRNDVNLDELTSSEIAWIQYHLVEMEYELPIYKDENGEKPKGDAAIGVNGKISNELKSAIRDYMNRYNIVDFNDFMDHINNKVMKGE